MVIIVLRIILIFACKDTTFSLITQVSYQQSLPLPSHHLQRTLLTSHPSIPFLAISPRVISHPYCYEHYDVFDTTCVIGCLMNDILILFLCLLSRMLFGVFLISFCLVPEDFPASILAIASYLFISPNIIRVFLTFFGSVLADFPASFPTSPKKTNTTSA